MAFTPNDVCTVVLTKEGANTLNQRGRRLNDVFGPNVNYRTDWKSGDEWRCQFWIMGQKFKDHWDAGAAMPFSDLRLEK